MKTIYTLPLSLCLAGVAAVAPPPAAASPDAARSAVAPGIPCVRKKVPLTSLPAELHRIAGVCGGVTCGRGKTGLQTVGLGQIWSGFITDFQPADQDVIVNAGKAMAAANKPSGKDLAYITYFAYSNPSRVLANATYVRCGVAAEETK